MTEKEWVEMIAPLAQNAQKKFGYLASVLIAQTIQETGYGQTDLAQVGRYDVLGMKKELLNDTWDSEYWHGGTFTKVTPEWYDGVETYITDTSEHMIIIKIVYMTIVNLCAMPNLEMEIINIGMFSERKTPKH